MLWLLLILGACGTPFRQPEPVSDAAFRKRAETVSEGGIRVSASIPDPEEARAIFGVDLEKNGIQPLWLEIENDTDRTIIFLPTGLDPDYFSPREVSFQYHAWFSDDANARLDDHIESLALWHIIDPRRKGSGFVFTHPGEGTKVVTMDLLGRDWTKSFTLFVPIPGYEPARERVEVLAGAATRPGSTEVDDESGLRELLERFPCCTAGKDAHPGGPLNVVLVGKFANVAPAFLVRNYRQAPADPRYLFRRPQDFAVGKRALWVAAQPHLVRLWLTSVRFKGKPVWVGEVSAPLGGRFARAAENGAEPPIDPEVDRSRNDLVQDLLYSQHVAALGFVKGAGQVPAHDPGATPGEGSYRTDGLRAVLFFEERPVSLSGIQFVDWERLADHYGQQRNGGTPKTGP